MRVWVMGIFVASVVTPILPVVSVAWYRQLRRDLKCFRNGFRFDPHRGGPMAGPTGKGW